MLCTKYSLNESDPWLTNELADAFAVAGHKVEVVAVDWSRPFDVPDERKIMTSGVTATVMSPVVFRGFGRFFEKISKWMFSSVKAVRIVRSILRQGDYDLVVGFSPAVTMALPILLAACCYKVKLYLIQWDFFPYHQRQIGMMPNRFVFEAARRVENILIRRFDYVGCMTLKNISYLRANYKLRAEQKVNVLPIWGGDDPIPKIDKAFVRHQYGLPAQAKIAVFGGQLTYGRGVEDILRVAGMAQRLNPDIFFLFVGLGPLEGLINSYIADGGGNVKLIQRVPREDYLALVSACDIGLVCTVSGVDVPTFPSKSIDYFRTMLPILASVESSTDFGEIIEGVRAGIAVPAGDISAFYSAILKLSNSSSMRENMGMSGFSFFNEQMTARIIAKKISEQLICGVY